MNGYLYECGNRKDLLDKIKKAYNNRDKLSKSSKEYVQEHSVEKSIDQLEALYKSLSTKS